jgi:hypothetical protein
VPSVDPVLTPPEQLSLAIAIYVGGVNGHIVVGLIPAVRVRPVARAEGDRRPLP